MAVRKGASPKLTAKDLRELNARRSAEYHALPQSADRAERREYVLRNINEENQERYFTAGEVTGESRALEVDLKDRTVKNVSFASDEPYLRWYGYEVLDHSPGAADFSRLNSGGAFVREHWGDQLGVVVRGSARFEGHKSRCDLLLSQRQEAKDELQDIADGIRCNTSFRYTVDEIRWEGTAADGEDIYRVLKWTPIHVASVSDPADFSVGFGKGLSTPNNQIDHDETRACVEGDPACEDESCPVCYEDDTTEDAAKSKRANQKRARKPMALRRKKSTKTAVAKDELCKEGDPVCDDRECEVHYEEDVEARETEASRAQEIVEFAEIYGERELALDYIAEGKDLKAVRAAIQAKRKKTSTASTPDPESPEAINARTRLAEETPRSLGVGRLKNFKTAGEAYRFGKFLAAGVFGLKNARNWCKEHGLALNRAHSESDNESGGIWVPTEFDDTFILLREQYGLFRGFADVTPMTSDHKIRRRQKGGLTAYPVGAVGSARRMKQSQMKWDAIELIARKWGILVKLEEELLEDTIIAYADKLVGEMAYGFAKAEDDCGFNADGTSTFHGIVGVRQALRNVSGTISQIKGLIVGAAGGWSSITQKNLTDLIAILPEYADDGGCAFYCHRTFYWSVIVPIRLAVGGITLAEISAEPIKQFLGYPVKISQILPKTSAVNQICLLFGDLDAAVTFGDRRGITVRQTDSNDIDFEQDLISMKATERFDINVHDVGDKVDPGPLVGLITAAS